MKIIGVSNFDDETVSDRVIAENVPQAYGEQIVRLLNDDMEEFDATFFKLVEDDYKLYKFEP